MSDEWYYELDGQQCGPTTTQALRDLAASGALEPTDRVRRGASGEWMLAQSTKHLFPTLAPPGVQVQQLVDQSQKSDAVTEAARDSAGDSPLDQVHNDVFSMEDAARIRLTPPDLAVSELKSSLDGFRALDYGFLIPVSKLVSGSVLRKKAVRWVIAFGLFPLLIAYMRQLLGLTFEQCAWALGGYFCLFWSMYFHGIIRPSPNAWRRGLRFAAFTTLVGIPLLLVAQELPIIRSLYSTTQSGWIVPRVLGFVLGVGLFEETCKALPLLIFVLRRRETITLKDGVFLGMMSGFGFALAEVVQYSVMFWNQGAAVSALAIVESLRGNSTHVETVLAQLSEFYGGLLLVQIIRFMTMPLLHASWAGICGWFIAIASSRSRPIPVVVVGISMVAIIHGLYDVFSDGLLGLTIAAASVLLFMVYLVHGQEQAIASPIAEQSSTVT